MAVLPKLPRPKRPADFQCEYLRAKTRTCSINFRHKAIKFVPQNCAAHYSIN